MLGVVRVRRTDAGSGPAGVLPGVGTVGPRDGAQGIAARSADRGRRQGYGQFAHGEQGEITLQPFQAADVFVETGQRDTETLGDAGQCEPVEADLVGHYGGFRDDARVGQAYAGHDSSYRLARASDMPAPVTQTSRSASETAAASASVVFKSR